jgi:hypothetical protein
MCCVDGLDVLFPLFTAHCSPVVFPVALYWNHFTAQIDAVVRGADVVAVIPALL